MLKAEHEARKRRAFRRRYVNLGRAVHLSYKDFGNKVVTKAISTAIHTNGYSYNEIDLNGLDDHHVKLIMNILNVLGRGGIRFRYMMNPYRNCIEIQFNWTSEALYNMTVKPKA